MHQRKQSISFTFKQHPPTFCSCTKKSSRVHAAPPVATGRSKATKYQVRPRLHQMEIGQKGFALIPNLDMDKYAFYLSAVSGFGNV